MPDSFESQTLTGLNCFFSFAHSDPRYVRFLERCLRRHGAGVALFHEKFPQGNLDDRIIDAINACDFQVVFCTRSSSHSSWVRKEVEYAERLGKKQVFLLLDPMKDMSWFDFHHHHSYRIDLNGFSSDSLLRNHLTSAIISSLAD